MSAWQKWSDIFALPQLMEDDPQRTGRPAAAATTPSAPAARNSWCAAALGNLPNTATVHRDEREIIARD